MYCNEAVISYNVLIKDDTHSICSVWERKACFSLRCKFILKILETISHIPVKKPWPGLTQNKIPQPNQPRKYS